MNALASPPTQPLSETLGTQLPKLNVDRVNVAHRIVLISIIIGLLWKVRYFIFADAVYESITIEDSFFPAWLRSHLTLRGAYLGLLTAAGVSAFSSHRQSRMIA
ncbi:MAG: hypothetical protein AAGA03_06045, partial [Planctomycetota bacterium]